jgi:hypothetical protein
MSFPNLEVGDLVYPAYDGKGGRCTACKVTEVINPTTIKVKGRFRGDDREIEAIFTYKQEEDAYKPLWSSWVKYGEEPTLMEMLSITDDDEEGDYYSLYDPKYFTLEWFNAEYLESLGFIHE